MLGGPAEPGGDARRDRHAEGDPQDGCRPSRDRDRQRATSLAGELGAHPDDHTITKRRWGAFTGTSLQDRLHSQDVTQIVHTGVATSIGVEALATDAMTDLDPGAHRHSVEKIFPGSASPPRQPRYSPRSA